jgi:hypothetical protein
MPREHTAGREDKIFALRTASGLDGPPVLIPELDRRFGRVRPVHASDNRRHVEIHLPAVKIFSGRRRALTQGINAAITADRDNDCDHPDETSGKDRLN